MAAEPIVLFRSEVAFQHELRVAKEHFEVIEQRCACPAGRFVVGRYSVLPFYRELELDLEIMGSRLVNTWGQHRWISEFEYYRDLKDYTPEASTMGAARATTSTQWGNTLHVTARNSSTSRPIIASVCVAKTAIRKAPCGPSPA